MPLTTAIFLIVFLRALFLIFHSYSSKHCYMKTFYLWNYINLLMYFFFTKCYHKNNFYSWRCLVLGQNCCTNFVDLGIFYKKSGFTYATWFIVPIHCYCYYLTHINACYYLIHITTSTTLFSMSRTSNGEGIPLILYTSGSLPPVKLIKKNPNLVHVTLSWQLKNRCVRIFHLTVSKQRMNITGLVTLLLFSLSTHPTVGQWVSIFSCLSGLTRNNTLPTNNIFWQWSLGVFFCL